jgi:prepilin-type N-terminal cleavage/methylation domain-containing protein
VAGDADHPLGHPLATTPYQLCSTHHAPRTTRRAFTLIEIMVVVGIMGIIMVLGVPLVYKVWHKAPMNKAVADIFELCSNARARAIWQGGATELIFHSTDGSIWVQNSQSSAPAKRADQGTVAAVPVSAPTVSGSGSGLATHLPENVAISKLYVSGVDCMEFEQARVRFFPNGTCDELIMQLLSDKGERVEISLEITTGLAFAEYDWSKLRLK